MTEAIALDKVALESPEDFEQYVSKFIGSPYVLNGTGDAGYDCRTLVVEFLRGQGVAVREDDGEPLPDEITPEVIDRYERGVEAAGQAVDLADLRRNDVVYYLNRHGRLHVGVWLGNGKILTINEKIGAHISKIDRSRLKGAVRGDVGIYLDNPLTVPPGKDPVSAVIAVLTAVGTAATAGIVTGTAAAVIGAIVVGATIYSVAVGLGAAQMGIESFDYGGTQAAGLGASPRYAMDGARNMRSNRFPVPLIYGSEGLRILNTFEIWNSGAGDATQKRLVVIGEGELGSITEVKLNGTDIADFTGSSYTAYVGTSSQSVDSRASGTNVVGLKNTAYLALTLKASDKLQGDPVITCKVTGRKVKTWSGSVWTGETASGNPAAALYDYLTLSRERGGCGFAEALLDADSFGDVFDYCEAQVDGEDRFKLDMIVDTFRPWLDNLTDMMSTFGGFLATDGRKFYLRVEKSESPVQAFTDDNVANMSYETFSKEDRPNRLVGVYIDPTAEGNDARTRIAIDDLVDQARNPRGIVPREIGMLGISRQSQAIRLLTSMMNDLRVNWYTISFTADIDAIALEPGDVFTMTHPVLGDGTTAYQFRALRITESENHSRQILGKAYNSSVFGDTSEQGVVTLNYTPPPDPFSPVDDVTDLIVTQVGYVEKDGTFVSNLRVSWTEPDETLYLKHYIIEWNEDAAGYVEKANVFPGNSEYTLANAKVGSDYTVRVKTISRYDIKSDGTATASFEVDGDKALPYDVTGFDVRQVGDELVLGWDANADLDIWGYELREGGSDWDSAGQIDTIISGRVYTIRNFTAGSKTYRIKAIDNSKNFSLNAAADSMTASQPSESNVLHRWDMFAESLANGAFSSGAEAIPTNDFNEGFRRPAISLKTVLRVDTYPDDWSDLEDDLQWDTEARETTEETYISEVVDLGSIQTGICGMTYDVYVPDGTVTIEWAYSEGDSTPDSYATFAEGVFTLRYYRLKVKIQTNDTTKNIRVFELNVQIDVKDMIDRGVNEAISSGGTVIPFTKTFSQTPAITITTVGSSAYVPVITAQSSTQFTCKLRDTEGAAFVSGNVNWQAKGY